MSADHAHSAVRPRTLAGATILQMIPSLANDALGRDAVNTAFYLLQAGVRAIIAADEGPLVNDFTGQGGEWLRLVHDSRPLRLRRNARTLEKFATSQRVDIIHAQGAAAGYTALLATANIPVWVVTSLPDVPPKTRWRAFWQSSLTRGDRVIVSSDYAAAPFLERYDIPRNRLSVVRRSVDTTMFDVATVAPERMAAVRQAWGVRADRRVILVPGRVAPANGQLGLVEAVRLLADQGLRGTSFVLAGDERGHSRYVNTVIKQATALGVADLIRLTGHCRDMPAAYATAELVVVPALTAPATGRVVAEAQAMARPVIASAVGPLPENLLGHARIPDDERTGWLVPAGDKPALAQAIVAALSIDDGAYAAMAGRARQFAEAMFSPQQVAASVCEVYTSVLARDL